ncbi:hypothetical protein FACS189411_00980 [Bacteroidia bacterium]|nr:hypothetical protein FACS189411_00980 [Bacteroidia bacterium]
MTDTASLKRNYKSNPEVFKALDSLLNLPEVYRHIDHIMITAAASPSGSVSHNDVLSRNRAKSLGDYIVQRYPDFDRSRISLAPIGIDWEGFMYFVGKDTNIPSRDEIIQLMQSTSDEEVLLQSLSRLPDQAQRYLKANIFPKLQYVSVRLQMDDGSFIPAGTGSPLRGFFEDSKPKEKVVRERVIKTDTVYIGTEKSRTDTIAKSRYPVFAVGTNLLYDAALLPNISVEAAFNKHFSLQLQAALAWYETKAPDYWSYRLQMLWLEGKYWWGSNPEPLTGPFVGLYGAVGKYDIRLFPKGGEPLGDLSHFSYSVGFTIGYSKPIGHRWNLEFSLGAGYLAGKYDKYNRTCAECYIWHDSKERQYFGPTKASVSLIYIFNK